MSASFLDAPVATRDESLAVELLESQRWGGVPTCPHCGTVGESYQMRDRQTGERSKRFLWRCRSCGRQYSVRVGTVMEDSRIPARHWVFAFWAACSSKKGVSALQIKRQTGLSYKSALFLMHRIRYAMIAGTPDGRPFLLEDELRILRTALKECEPWAHAITGASPHVVTVPPRVPESGHAANCPGCLARRALNLKAVLS